MVTYDPESGVFTRTDECGSRPAFVHATTKGYPRLWYNGATVSCYLLAYELMGVLVPADRIVSPMDGDHMNTKWDNLVLISASRRRLISRTVVRELPRGVSYFPNRNRKARFKAKLTYKGKDVFSRWYETADEAGAAYVNAKRELMAAPGV